jgi:pimeloyl-ACP methyl ester carboxylesterase
MTFATHTAILPLVKKSLIHKASMYNLQIKPNIQLIMKKGLIFLPLFCLFFQMTTAQDITGSWHGALDIQGTQLRLVFHIEKTADGYATKMDSPDQGASGIPTDATTWKENTLTIKAAALGMEYNAQLKDGKLEGTFSQAGMNLPLLLEKKAGDSKPKPRPQDPKDFPYHQEEVAFFNQKDDIKLAGTLTLPQDKKVKQVVMLISGSGPQDRNEELLGGINHRPFLVLSDYLTRQGIGVLRYDDRGVGESTGDRSVSTIEDFAEDAEAGVAYLKSRKDLQGVKIGLAGHSEGGMVGPIVAARNKAVDFMILLAGPGIPIDELLIMQSELVSRAAGAPAAVVEAGNKVNRDIYGFLKKNEDQSIDKLRPQVEKLFEKGLLYFPEEEQKKFKESGKTFEKEAQTVLTPWFLNFIRTTPADYLSKVKVPVLALNGTLDLQVPAKENLAGIESALKKAGNKNVEIAALEGLNHLFQKATTGAPSEYGQIEETFHEPVMARMAHWIKKQ